MLMPTTAEQALCTQRIHTDTEATADARKTVRDAMRTARRLRRPCRDCTWTVECILAGRLPDDVRAAIVANNAEAAAPPSSAGPSPDTTAPGAAQPSGRPQQQKQRGGGAAPAVPEQQLQQRPQVGPQRGRPQLLERLEGPPDGVEVAACDNRTFYNAAQLVRCCFPAPPCSMTPHPLPCRPTRTWCAVAGLWSERHKGSPPYCKWLPSGRSPVGAGAWCTWHWLAKCIVPMKPCLARESRPTWSSCLVASTCSLACP